MSADIEAIEAAVAQAIARALAEAGGADELMARFAGANYESFTAAARDAIRAHHAAMEHFGWYVHVPIVAQPMRPISRALVDEEALACAFLADARAAATRSKPARQALAQVAASIRVRITDRGPPGGPKR